MGLMWQQPSALLIAKAWMSTVSRADAAMCLVDGYHLGSYLRRTYRYTKPGY